MSQYVGKLISLVDTNNIRYGGVLASISAETSSLVLSDVIVYGTESRVTGPGSVAPEREPRQRMEFKGTDVNDLQVLESEPVAKAEETRPQQTTNETTNDANDARGGRDPEDRSGDDDFYSRTQRLAASHEEGEVQATKAYEKSSSFFDNLGGSSGTRGKEFRDQDRSMNLETFGETGYSSRGGRGRGRGQGRGRGRRGGHQQPETQSRGERAQRNDTQNSTHSDAQNRTHNDTREHTRENARGDRTRSGGRSRGGDRTRGGDRSRGGQNAPTVTEFVPGGQFA